MSTLSQWQPSCLYDMVFSIDLLFHILDDDERRASMVNLASMAQLGGRLLLADHSAEEDKVWNPSQKTRARARYVDLVVGQGFADLGFHANGGPRDPIGLHAFGRVA